MLDTDNNIHYNLKKRILLCQPPIFVCTLNDITIAYVKCKWLWYSDHPISSFFFFFFLKREKELFDFVCVYV